MTNIQDVYIMGAGEFGKYVYSQLIRYKENWNILGYIDSDINKKGIQKDGLEICYLPEVKIDTTVNDIVVFIAIVKEEGKEELVYYLNSVGFCNIYEVRSTAFFYKTEFVTKFGLDLKYVQKYKTEDGGKVLPILKYLETHVMNGCNMKCKGCSHFSNLFAIDDEVKYEKFEKDIVRMSEICDITLFRLLGGEPLLNGNLIQYLKIVREMFPHTDLHVATNGILIKECEEEILKYMSDNNIFFDITLYKSVLFMKENITKKLERYNVSYNLNENCGKFEKMLTLQGDKNPKDNINKCNRKICLTLKEGNLYRCAISAHVSRFNEVYGTDIARETLFNIYNDSIEDLWKIALDYPDKEVSTCSYCSNPPVSFCWESSPNPQKEEWLV